MMFKKSQYWCFVKSRTNSKLESKLVDRGIPTEWIRKTGKKTKKYQGAWLVDSKKKGENPTLLEDDKKEIERQINYLLKEKYTILHYNNTNTIIKQIYEQVPYTKKFRENNKRRTRRIGL